MLSSQCHTRKKIEVSGEGSGGIRAREARVAARLPPAARATHNTHTHNTQARGAGARGGHGPSSVLSLRQSRHERFVALHLRQRECSLAKVVFDVDLCPVP